PSCYAASSPTSRWECIKSTNTASSPPTVRYSSRKKGRRSGGSRYNATMSAAEKYLQPKVIRQVARLDLRAKFIVEGFLAGLHASPFQGFSVEFSEHRKYVPGDDLKDLDWTVYAKTEKYYIRKYEAETNLTGYLVMDLSAS